MGRLEIIRAKLHKKYPHPTAEQIAEDDELWMLIEVDKARRETEEKVRGRELLGAVLQNYFQRMYGEDVVRGEE